MAEDFLPIRGWDHVEFYVGNARQAAHFYDKVFGFQPVAKLGLETGVRDRCSYMLQQGNIRFVLTSPEFLSSMRIVPPWLEWYEDDFGDDSVAKQKADAALTRETLETLRSYDRADQTSAQLLSTDILDWFLDQQVRGEKYMFHAYPVTQLFGIQNQLPEFMVETHQINSVDDDVATLLVIGHEPTTSQVALILADPGQSDTDAVEGIATKFPTSAIAVLRIGEPWRQLEPGRGALVTFHVPR